MGQGSVNGYKQMNEPRQRKIHDNSGLTLLELLISIAILGIIMTSLYQVVGTPLSAYEGTREKQDLLAQARFVMERMVMFVQETDDIDKPQLHQANTPWLEISERVVDTYDNATYDIDGDGYLDANNDSDDLVNEDIVQPDPPEYIRFDLDKSDGSNWKLMEEMPDYSTSNLNDHKAEEVICEHVTLFNCSHLSTNLVEIELTLNNGNSEVSLKTRAKARFIEPD